MTSQDASQSAAVQQSQVQPRAALAISVAGSPDRVLCPQGASVLDAFERRNMALAQGGEMIRVGCRRGGCGICKVRILSGNYHAKTMSRAHISEEQEAHGTVLACCVYPETDLIVEAVPVAPRQF
jgi:ferredoxin